MYGTIPYVPVSSIVHRAFRFSEERSFPFSNGFDSIL